MPPKQKGHNARGKKKIFRNAVENVRIGVGHTTIGNVSLQLAAGVPTPESESSTSQCAFYLELNQQLLSHSSKDFTRFRWEVLELCETRDILLLHHREVAEALLARLLDRSTGVYTGHSSTANAQGSTDRGLTLEGYDAFLRLTIAFARDMKSKFLSYFEVFQQAVQAGLFDKNGNVIASAERLQLLYSVQAVWCREMLDFWEDPQYNSLVRRIIRIYINQLRDTKEYIRRLSAELLAFLCRLCRREILPLVVKEACTEICRDYITFALQSSEDLHAEDEEAPAAAEMEGDDSSEDSDEERSVASEPEDDEEPNSAKKATEGEIQEKTWNSIHYQRFLKEVLEVHPILDGLTFYAADLFRGIRGTLSTGMEFFYIHLLQSFGLVPENQETLSTFVEALLTEYHTYSSLARGRIVDLMKEVGSFSVKQALSVVLIETRKQSVKSLEHSSSDDEEYDNVNEISSASDRPSHRLLAAVVQSFVPDEFHLRILDALLKTSNYFIWRDEHEDALLKKIAQSLIERLRSMKSKLSAPVHDILAFCGAALELLMALCVSPYVTGEFDYGKPQEGKMNRPLQVQQLFLAVGKEVVSTLSAIAFSTSTFSESSETSETGDLWGDSMTNAEAAQTLLLAFVQDVFCKNYCFCLAEERRLHEDQDATGYSGEGEEAEYEDESSTSLKSSKKATKLTVKSLLTPLALTLVRSICMKWWETANSVLGPICQAADSIDKLFTVHQWIATRRLLERSVLLLRMTCDRTMHAKSTPLEQIFRLQSVQSKKSKSPAPAGSDSKGSTVQVLLHHFLVSVAKWFWTVKHRNKAVKKSLALSWFATEAASELFVCLLPLSSTVLMNMPQQAEALQEWSRLLLQIQRETTLETVGTTSYLVHAHVSLSLLRLSSDKSAVSATTMSASEGLLTETQEASIQHLSNTIDLLFRGFDTAARQSVGESDRSSGDGQQWETIRAELPSSGSDRSQLYRASEIMLEALSVAIRVDERNELGSIGSAKRLQKLKEAALLLKKHLAPSVQEHLAQILLEALVAPLQSLRVSALQLLQILCHPTLISAEERLSGLSGVESFVFSSLLGAECYNPLSHSGNMDGLRSALNPLVSPVERGAISDPLTKIIIGRSMIGLYHLKFSEAWPIAQRMLTELSKTEGSRGGQDDDAVIVHSTSFSFWDAVLCRYARLLTLGEASATKEATYEYSGSETKDAKLTIVLEKAEQALSRLVESYKLYRIRLTDQQRHEKGEMISRAFSSSLYRASRYTVVDLPSRDGEIVSWSAHWRAVHLSASSVQSAIYRGATDAATVAKTFLAGLVLTTKNISKATDHRLRLVEQLLFELSAIYHNDHPCGVPVVLKRIDERVELAMQACSNGPSLTLSNAERQRLSTSIQENIQKRSSQLSILCSSYLADGNSRLQRAAIDNLKRLKVEPFVTHYSKLTPYADNMKSLFGFLAGFHIETEIPVSDRPSYISAVLTIALPKFIAKVSKEKRRDQAVLQRRILAFLQHMIAPGSEETAPLSLVVTQLLKRLIFTEVQHLDTLDMNDLEFMHFWESKVDSDDRQCGRYIERLHKKLLSSLRLMESLINAVGMEFGDCVKLTLTLALQAYLVGCKQKLLAPVDRKLLSLEEEADNGMHEDLKSPKRSGALSRLRHTINSRVFSTMTAHVRRSAVHVVALLTEQFPGEVMETLQLYFQQSHSTQDSVFGQYIHLLFINSKGATRDAEQSKGTKSSKGYTTPLLRLVRAWLQAPSLLSLIPTFADEVTGTFLEVFALNSSAQAAGDTKFQRQTGNVYKAQTKDVYEALSCVTDILRLSDEEVEHLSCAAMVAVGSKNKKEGKMKTSQKGTTGSLRSLFVMPYFPPIFEALYRLIARGAENSEASSNTYNASASAKTVMSFSPQLWRELFHTVTALTSLTRHASDAEKKKMENMDEMQEKLLEIAIRFTSHPVCVNDNSTLLVALDELEHLVDALPHLDEERHYYPILKLFNALPTPMARIQLSRIFHMVVTKIPLYRTAAPQLDAVARAVKCLNSFDEDNTALDRYDFDLRFHTFNSLKKFFVNDGNYGALSGSNKHDEMQEEAVPVQKNHVRKEREYSGELDVLLPLDKKAYPVLLVEGISILAANTMFFLRDAESTIRTFARHLLHAMMQYASRIKDETTKQDILERVVRRIVLPSLRRGVVARDVHIRAEHMSSFGALGKFFPSTFPSFAQLHSSNSEENFFLNVCHVQPKSRLNALGILRRQAEKIHVRDMLRVFIPFLMSAVKDFAQGKRDLQNLTEGKAKGYCDAVLMTIASICQNLPWMAYHRVLSLLLTNAGSNPDLRLPMLRGVVQVLDHFHYLDEGRVLRRNDVQMEKNGEDSDEDARDAAGSDDEERDVANEEERVKYYHARIIQTLEREILPQLLEFICDAKTRRGLGIQDNLSGQHNVSTLRREEEKKAKGAMKNSIIQLPVAIAITKIVKKLPEAQCNEYMDMLLDEVISKLRTKNDKQRESARRILGVMLQEAGPGKLQYVIKKLKGHLVHGYQLHVLGYTIVTLLYQLYEPHNALLKSDSNSGAHATRYDGAKGKQEAEVDVIQDALNLMNAQSASAPEKKRHRTDTSRKAESNQFSHRANDSINEDSSPTTTDPDTLIELAEEELIRQLVPASTMFDPSYGVECLTAALDDLLLIFLDDYLGEIGHQKEQIELMSKMVEVKRNRSLQGFNLLARHVKAEEMMSMFIKRVSWVLTPPSESEALALSNTEGSAHVRTLIKAEIQKKYTTVGKAATADIVFVKKVRALSLSVAKNFLINPTLEVDQALDQVRSLLGKHNQVREERIQAFEAKDGTRRVRGNAHMLIQSAPRTTLKEQQDKNFLVAPEPERVDVDFSAHTVLTTQQKQKLKVYKGRYAKELQQASKDFYREDATTAVVLDTLDEFLLRLLLSMLRKVLGIGRDKHRHSVVELDLLRRKRRKNGRNTEDEDEQEPGDEPAMSENAEEEEPEEEEGEEGEEQEEEGLNPATIDEDRDDLEHFASAASESMAALPKEKERGGTKNAKEIHPENIIPDLNVAFTSEHREMLEKLLIVVLTTLEGEGSDAVVAHALDVVLALVSLRPPLDVARENDRLLQTVVMYFERGGPIKQRAMRVCAGIISHQRFHLTIEEAKRMVMIIRGEVIDRTEYLPMALSLLYAILGKHIPLVEIYDLIDLLTELLVHLSGKRFIRTRSILSVVRFLTEYKLTPQKFRSHIDLICRNLDFPEMGGRLALLDLIDALLVRLPTVVLRQEAPVFLIPLAALTSQGEFQQDRKRSGEVLQTLVKHAGIDVLAPELQGWIDPSKDRPMRTMGMQAIALCMKTLQNVYGPTVESDEESCEAFVGSVTWCIPFVMEACRYVPPKSMIDGKKKTKKEEAKKKGWSLIFYALRATESIVYTAPKHFYPTMAPQLMPLIAEHLLLHPHAWVRGVCFRLLNHYCYSFVEAKCHYLQDALPMEEGVVGGGDENEEGMGKTDNFRQTNGTVELLPLVYSSQHSQTLIQYISPVIKRLLTVVEKSDIDKEKHQANVAIDDPSRAELLKSLIYLTKAFLQCCVAHLVREKGSSSSKDFIAKQFEGLHRHIQSISSPVLKQGSVVNYVLRTTTLVQFFGGYIGVLPRGGEQSVSGDEDAYAFRQASIWILTKGSQILTLVKSVAAPLMNMAIGASVLSHRLSTLAYQSLKVIQQQLEERRTLLVLALEEGTAKKGKRARAESDGGSSADLDSVLAVLVEKESATYQEKQVKRIRTEVQKNLKKNRHEAEKAANGGKRSRSK